MTQEKAMVESQILTLLTSVTNERSIGYPFGYDVSVLETVLSRP